MDFDLGSPPKVVDEFLQNKYTISLYYFAVSLVDVFFFIDYRKVMMPKLPNLDCDVPWNDFWLERIEELKKMKKSSHTSTTNWNEFLQLAKDPYLLSYRDKITQISKHLMATKDIAKPIDFLIDKISELFLTHKKGSPINELNILFLVWSHFICDQNKTHFQILIRLLNWFALRIPHDEYFKTDDIDDDNLKKELHRYRKSRLGAMNQIVNEYKARFLSLINYRWLERSYAYKNKFCESLINFVNGEILTIKECKDNCNSAKFPLLKKFRHNNFPIILDFYSQEIAKEGSTEDWNFKLIDLINEIGETSFVVVR
jgi:hypothetical protein